MKSKQCEKEKECRNQAIGSYFSETSTYKMLGNLCKE